MTAMAPTGLKATVQDTNLLQERSGCLPLALRTVWLRLATGLLANLHLITAATAFTAAVRTTAATIGPTGVTGGKLGDARQSAIQRGDKMRTLVAERDAARLRHVACQEITR